ncbi:tRNA (adenosine(37)-N6)-threonylcarbamoyltransferase complex transferase subunit TsaD [Candidatus Woesearchaeota archaeon]|nr:tRNA (adenosine(37)-N6)-threonylcarbamoyltransferase complex transferase subunit TsaD [Candidatus Woesearchaeota archaeon]
MNCLGIESTAHTFGIAVVSDKEKILSNEKEVFTTSSGGMIPNKVAEHHKRVCDSVLKKALEKANVKIEEIGLISYSHGPGLSPALVVGKDFAKSLALNHKKNIIGVNHCIAHLTIGTLVTPAKDPVYLYVSGVNTQVIALAGGKFRIFGETLDIGLGNALDKFGREAGLGFPAGPVIEKLALEGKYIELPYTVKGMDVSFAGLVTKTKQLLEKGEKVEDLCYSIQETCFAMLAEVSERAMAHCEKNELLLIGGVGANKRLIEMLEKMCSERNAKFYSVPLEYAGDQAAMIAWQGILEFNAGKRISEIDIYPYERVDDVDVIWQQSKLEL